jgi:hypothetical protein
VRKCMKMVGLMPGLAVGRSEKAKAEAVVEGNLPFS